MRKISKAAADAFMRGVNFRSSNTTVEVDGDEVVMRLFGNAIAYKRGINISITSAGWQTATTKERLNAIPNVNLVQRKGEWYLNGKLWNGKITKLPRYYQADIRWLDTGEEVECMTIKVGDADDDDRVFFYVESEDELMSLYNEGVEEFVITAHHSITLN